MFGHQTFPVWTGVSKKTLVNRLEIRSGTLIKTNHFVLIYSSGTLTKEELFVDTD